MVTFDEIKRGFLRLVRFSTVGVFNTLVSYLVFALFVRMGFHYVAATFAAFVVGMLMGFKLHGAFVFDHSGSGRFLRYTLIALAVFFCGLVVQALVRGTVNDYVAGAIACAITVPVSFLLNRAFVFHAPPTSDQES